MQLPGTMVGERLVVATGVMSLQLLCQTEFRAGAAAAPGKRAESFALCKALEAMQQGEKLPC